MSDVLNGNVKILVHHHHVAARDTHETFAIPYVATYNREKDLFVVSFSNWKGAEFYGEYMQSNLGGRGRHFDHHDQGPLMELDMYLRKYAFRQRHSEDYTVRTVDGYLVVSFPAVLKKYVLEYMQYKINTGNLGLNLSLVELGHGKKDLQFPVPLKSVKTKAQPQRTPKKPFNSHDANTAAEQEVPSTDSSPENANPADRTAVAHAVVVRDGHAVLRHRFPINKGEGQKNPDNPNKAKSAACAIQ